MKIPVVLDVRDLWPEIFFNLFPKWSHEAAKIAFLPFSKRTEAAFNYAYAVTGITPNLVRWGVKQAGRDASEMDRSFPFGYLAKSPSLKAIEDAKIFWSKLGIKPDDGYYNVCFFGTIGHQFDLETVIEAAKIMQNLNNKVRFILCGTGDRLLDYKSMAANLNNVIFPGWIGFPEIWVLMKYSSVGIAPYKSSSNFQENIPNKIIEYFAGKLPILSCINGIVDQIISVHKCGFTYERGNANSLIMELMKLLDNPNLMEKMAQNAFSIYQEKYNAEAVYGEMIEYLEDMAKTFKRRAA
jgi:glycosyltransferase involved in cell wall biosynthesis